MCGTVGLDRQLQEQVSNLIVLGDFGHPFFQFLNECDSLFQVANTFNCNKNE